MWVLFMLLYLAVVKYTYFLFRMHHLPLNIYQVPGLVICDRFRLLTWVYISVVSLLFPLNELNPLPKV